MYFIFFRFFRSFSFEFLNRPHFYLYNWYSTQRFYYYKKHENIHNWLTTTECNEYCQRSGDIRLLYYSWL